MQNDVHSFVARNVSKYWRTVKASGGDITQPCNERFYFMVILRFYELLENGVINHSDSSFLTMKKTFVAFTILEILETFVKNPRTRELLLPSE